MNTIRLAVEYVAELDPAFAERIRGAAPEDVAALERAARRPLPNVYVSFLLLMGGGMDWLDVGGVDFRIGTVLDFCRTTTVFSPPPDVLIGVDRTDPYFHAYIAPQGPSLRVVRMPNMADTVKAKERYAIGVAGSLEEMVGRTAFERCRVAIQPHRVELTHDVRQADALRRLDATMRILRLHRLWFSTGWGACYEGHGLVATATQPGDYALSVIVAGPDAIEVATAADRLVSYLGVTIKRQAPPPA